MFPIEMLKIINEQLFGTGQKWGLTMKV